MISCIILSAGESTRFGSPKALARIHNTTCIETLQEKILLTSADEIIIVLGHAQNQIKPYVFNHKKVRVVYNKNYKFGQTSSVQVGLSAVNDKSTGFMLVPVDCPSIKLSSIDQIIENFKQEYPILIPTFRKKRGHPPIFNSLFKNEILKLPLTQGINSLFKMYPPIELAIDDNGIVQSFNTKEELRNLFK